MLFVQLALDLKADLPAAQLLRGDLLMAGERYEDAVEAYRRVDKASALFLECAAEARRCAGSSSTAATRRSRSCRT